MGIPKRRHDRSKEIIKRLQNAVSISNRFLYYPLVVKEAHDCTVTDVDGNTFLDFNSGWTVAGLGYSNPQVSNAVQAELARSGGVATLTFPSETTVRFAERLIGITPGTFEKKVWFGHSGADACGAVYKLFPLATKRQRIISFYGSMHGMDLAGIAMGGLPMLSNIPVPNLVTKVPYAYCYRCPFGLEYPSCGIYCASDFIENHVFKSINPPEDTSFMIVEPIQSDGGDVVPPAGYLEKLKKTCDRFGILFVSDEVKIGFGRTGKMFGIEHSPTVIPDAVIMGKSIASGIPISAVVARKELLDSAMVTSTLTGNTLGAAAGLTTLEVLEKSDLLRNASRVGALMKRRLEEMRSSHELIGDVRGKGLIIGVELVEDKKSKKPAKRETAKTVFRAWQLGLLVAYMGMHSNVIEVIPPLTITPEKADEGLAILDHALRDVESGLVSDSSVREYNPW